MLRALSAVFYIAALVALIAGLAGEIDGWTSVYLILANVVSGSVLWGIGSIQEDVKVIRMRSVTVEKPSDVDKRTQYAVCAHCSGASPASSKFCIHCGKEL